MSEQRCIDGLCCLACVLGPAPVAHGSDLVCVSPWLLQTVVTGTAVIPTKTLPLVLKAATPSMPTSILTPRPSVAMVTTLSHMAKPAPQSSDQTQTTPLGLQAAGKLTSQGTEALRIVSKNAVLVSTHPALHALHTGCLMILYVSVLVD